GVAVDRGVGVTANRVGRKRVVGTRESLDVARDALRAPFTPVATHSADLSAAHRQLVDAAPRRSGAVVELRSVSDSWRNRKTLILSRADMMGLVSPAEYILCVEQAYRMHGEGRFYMDPKGHIVLDKYPGEWEAMPSYIEEPEAAACKWVSIREQNRERFDLPTVFSIL